MMRWLCFAIVLLAAPVCAQSVPVIPYESVPNAVRLPPNMYLGEVAGVAVNSKKHVFVYSRGNTSGPAFGASASQLLEFAPDGRYLREIGRNLYAWAFAHTVRIDKQDNIWATDKGSDMVVKFTPDGRVDMVFGRKQEASDEAAPHKRSGPPPKHEDGRFRQPTDVTWDPAGNTFISDGYVNARVAKVDKNGNWLKSWGERGDKPGEFNTPHSIAADAQGNIYVGDRGNGRIQVFDGDGKFLREIKIDVPFDRNAARAAIGNKPPEDVKGTQAPRRALGDLYHAGTEADSLQRGCLSRAHLQVDSGRHAAWRARRSRQTAQTVRLDSRDGLPVGKRALRRRSVKLARAEIDSSPRSGNRHGALRRGSIGDFVVGRAKIFRRDLNALSVEAQHLDVTTLVSASFRSVPWHKHWRGMEPNLYP